MSLSADRGARVDNNHTMLKRMQVHGTQGLSLENIVQVPLEPNQTIQVIAYQGLAMPYHTSE